MKWTRFLSFLLCIVLLTALVPQANAKYFSDVDRDVLGTTQFDAINYMTDNGYMNGRNYFL